METQVPAPRQPDDRSLPPAPAVSPLLMALRQGTQAAHQRIEALAPMACLLSPRLTAGAYVAVLRAMHGFHVTMHKNLAPFVAANPSLRGPDPRAIAALADDLAWFGAPIPSPPGGRMRIGNPAAALGALYVVEGSALGGRVIGRAVAQSLSVSPGRGGSFYGGTTADGARQRWLEFCTVLACEGAALSQTGVSSAIAGANATFLSLERRLQGGEGATPRPRLAALGPGAGTAMPGRARAATRPMI